ncbi:hypothetical protein OnM2_028041 [Erysiphe neolycopersici]|uniref:Uncharacterized protein n=1 Tax=Erysiphe neolycopersici TaxID=212602 RepID=A0A420I075_9PEZI|nr:hypothetical protein OnM2_028041 [Erysiphe neolycopersici]
MVECEGQDPDKTDIELLDEFYSFTLVDCQEEAFHTTFGSMTSIQATKVVLRLCNQSEEHAPTKRITPFELEKKNRSFINEGRYSSAKFHGTLIDTGAAGHSTAGYGQYQAFNETFEFYPID